MKNQTEISDVIPQDAEEELIVTPETEARMTLTRLPRKASAKQREALFRFLQSPARVPVNVT